MELAFIFDMLKQMCPGAYGNSIHNLLKGSHKSTKIH